MRFRKSPAAKASVVVVLLMLGITNVSKSIWGPGLSSSPMEWDSPTAKIPYERSSEPDQQLDTFSKNVGTFNSTLDSTWPVPIRKMFMADGVPTNNTRLLLDFVIAGFAKCGTTALGSWFGSHPEIKIQKGEQYHYTGDIKKMVLSLFFNLPKSGPISPYEMKKGFRSPHFIQTYQGNLYLHKHFPDAKIIVTVRHPLLWFESYYNYRLEQNELMLLKGTPNELIGELTCRGCKMHFILSTAKGHFHRYLARLRKTPLSDPDELQWLGSPHGQEKPPLENMIKINNPVFFMEMSQLGDSNETRSKQLRRDLQKFLGLKTEFHGNEIPKIRPSRAIIQKYPQNFTRVNLCEDEYLPVRTELMHTSRNASIWFRKYFLQSNEVFVSSREYLVEILEGWMEDLCQQRAAKSAG